MELEIILNELSLPSNLTPIVNDIPTARQLMKEFIITLIQARKNISEANNKLPRTHRSFDITKIILAPDYPLARWLNDNSVNRDERTFFKTFFAKASFLPDLPQDIEFRYQGNLAPGLGNAYLREALAISTTSEQHWDSNYLELELIKLGIDGSLNSQEVKVVHCSKLVHITEHNSWIKSRLQAGIRDGLDLWMRREELFPTLNFCEHLEKQLQAIRLGDQKLEPIKNRLFELENYCKEWKTGPFDLENFPSKVSQESAITLQQFGSERTFRCPDGKTRLFNWHVRLTPGAWRIHFFPEAGKIIIGYIGPHLPTVSDPT